MREKENEQMQAIAQAMQIGNAAGADNFVGNARAQFAFICAPRSTRNHQRNILYRVIDYATDYGARALAPLHDLTEADFDGDELALYKHITGDYLRDDGEIDIPSLNADEVATGIRTDPDVRASTAPAVIASDLQADRDALKAARAARQRQRQVLEIYDICVQLCDEKMTNRQAIERIKQAAVKWEAQTACGVRYLDPYAPDDPDDIGLFTFGDEAAPRYFPKKCIHLVLGAKRSGKTTLCSVIAGAAISDHEVLGFRAARQMRVILFATEENDPDAKKRVRQAYQLAGVGGVNNDALRVASVVGDTPEARKKNILAEVLKERPDIAIIDGIADLISGVNEDIEARQLCFDLMRLAAAANCAIINVIHTNPNGGDTPKARGHIGTELSNKVITALAATHGKESCYFDVTDGDSRHAPFPGLRYERDADGLPRLIEVQAAPPTPTPPKQTKQIQRHQDALAEMTAAFDHDSTLTRQELLRRITPDGKATTKTQRDHIDRAIMHGVITEAPDGKNGKIYTFVG